MKKYRYVRIRRGLISMRYRSGGKRGSKSPREIIDEQAASGYVFKGTVPVYVSMTGMEYDLVFEKDI